MRWLKDICAVLAQWCSQVGGKGIIASSSLGWTQKLSKEQVYHRQPHVQG